LAIIALPTNSFALGLGEIEVNSFLNQPLNAEIKVISARAGEIDDLLVTLASRDSFKRAGLSRPRHLSELRFAVKKNEEGDSAVILVTTKSAVKEPFLNFLVEADWSKGRVLREYTVLLDPPFYADTPAPAETASQPTISQPTISQSTTTSTSISKPIVDEVTISEPVTPIATSTPSTSGDEQTITEPIAVSQEPDSGSESEDIQTIIADESEPVIVGDLRVVKGDTLWSLASQFKDSEHSMDQVMLAIQRMNPEAFNDNNINNMKAGAVLRAPDGEQLDRINKRAAHVEVLEQHGLWDIYVARVTGSTPVAMAGDGSDSGASGVSGDSGSDLSDLSLLAPGDGDSDAAGLRGAGVDADELGRQLALAEEELDASKVENSDLESRIAELEATLSKVRELQKMVEIEDDSLAQLQADQAAEAAETALAEAAAAEQAAAEEQTALEQAIEEAARQAEQELAAVSSSEEEDEALLEEMLAAEAAAEAARQEANVTPPAPVIITEPVQESDSMLDGIIPPEILDTLTGVLDLLPSMDSILGDPIMLGALGGIVVLLLGLVMYKRRKGSDSDEAGVTDSVSDDDLFTSEEDFTPIHLASEEGGGETDINVPSAQNLEDDAEDLAPTAIIPQIEVADTVAQEPASKDQDDTLNEVDVYLAYGLYDNAEDLLKQSLDGSPERADYRAKLLDTYFATKDVAKFSEQAETLKSMGAAAEPYWVRVQAMGYELAPDNALFSGGKDSDVSTADFGVTKPEAADFDLGANEDNTNFSTTDFNLGEESEDFTDTQNFVETVVREEAEPEVAEELPDLDELTGLDSSDATNIGGTDSSDEAGDDSGELEFAFDGEAEAQKDAADDGAMDFELPEDGDIGTDDSAAESDDVSMDFDMEETLGFDSDDSADQEDEEEEENIEATAIISMVDEFEDGTAFEDRTAFDFDTDDDSDQASGAIDLGMDDTSVDDADDNLETTAFTSAVDEDIVDAGDDLAFDLGDDIAAMDIDFDSEPPKTDTFAPGDFDDPEELIADETNIEDVSIDDMDDLMLPDDVDEVGTKLDLARAFIDMGDTEGARSSLDEVLAEGNEDQKAEATDIIKHI
jgi:pilus assembly protein FimV